VSGGSPLREILRDSRARGFLGRGPIDTHVDHALALAAATIIGDSPDADVPARVLDLGAGGGVPGLVLAGLWPSCSVVLLESNHRRSEWLQGAISALGWLDRVEVVCERAEVSGRDPNRRAGFDAVTARGFAKPAVTAECAAPLLRVGGRLVVSEPPAAGSDRAGPGLPTPRWPEAGCLLLGLRPIAYVATPYACQVLEQTSLCPAAYPRRTGVPSKRPLF
jgi:16S rRNA (guanine527-N7)-methyltransferase